MQCKFYILVLIFLISVKAFAQINLKLGKYTSVKRDFKMSTERALNIASFILSTQEFKDSLLKHKFHCNNIRKKVRVGCEPVTGLQVYDSLIKYKDTTINIVIKRLSFIGRFIDKHDQIGKSKYNTFKITTNSWYLNRFSTKRLAEQGYAAHIAHEYSHIRGYTHKGHSHQSDVAEEVGDIVGEIIKRRVKNNEPISF